MFNKNITVKKTSILLTALLIVIFFSAFFPQEVLTYPDLDPNSDTVKAGGYVTVTSGTANGGVETNYTGLWTMDDNAASPTVTDSSGNGNDGTFYDAGGDPNTSAHHTDSGATPSLNGALVFDGTDDSIDIGDIIGSGAYTKVAWVNLVDGAVNDRYNILSSDGPLASYHHVFWAPGFMSHRLAAGNRDYETVSDTVGMSHDTWYQVAVTFDPDVAGGTMQLYKNGEPVGNTATGVPIQSASATSYIGRFENDYLFKGTIDNVMLFNRALTAAEISDLYDGGNGKNELDETRYWLNNYHNQRIRQDGSLTQVTLYFASKPSNVSAFYFMVWRKNGSTWDKIAEEDIWPQVTGGQVNTITLATPMTVQEGDYVGYGAVHVGSATFMYGLTGSGAATYYADNEVPSDTDYAWSSETSTTTYFPMNVYMQAPVMVTMGDSIVSGYPAHRSYIETTDINDRTTTIAYHLSSLTGYTYQNMGISSQTTTQISERFTADVVNLKPRIAVIEGGVNDIRNGSVTQATFIANWTSMLNACQANGIVPIVVKILPWSYSASYGGTNTQLQTRDTWNDALAELAVNYPTAIVVDASSYVGQNRASPGTVPGDVTPGNLWDMKSEYDSGDGLHFNSDGHAQIAQAIADALLPTATFDNDFSSWEHGDVTVNYNLAQAGGANTLNISQAVSSGIEYSTDGSTWHDATDGGGTSEGLTGLDSSASPGTNHVFVWNSSADLPNTEDSTVYLRVRPNDGTSDAKSWVTSNAFGVDNVVPSSVGVSSVTADSTSQITVAAQTAIDAGSGLHATPYWFDRDNGAANSGWQTSIIWVDTGLAVNTQYTYKVKTRDAAGNESEFSETVSRPTLGGSGGSRNSTSTPGPIFSMTIGEIKTEINRITLLINQLQSQIFQFQTAINEIPSGYQFIKILKYGQTSDEVRYLQIFLKLQGVEIYPEGIVSSWFGPLTKKAVIRFQEKYTKEILAPWGLTQGTGYVGPHTQKKLNSLLGK